MQRIQQNRFIIIAAGAIVTALVIFVAVSIPSRGGPQKTKSGGALVATSCTGLDVCQTKFDADASQVLQGSLCTGEISLFNRLAEFGLKPALAR